MGVSFEKQTKVRQEQVLGGAEEAEIADLHEVSGQDVLEEAMDELFGGEVQNMTRPLAKGDLVVFEFY